jgi:hypothetical protein
MPIARPIIKHVTLGKLASADVSVHSTLYVPPIASAPLDQEMLRRFAAE